MEDFAETLRKACEAEYKFVMKYREQLLAAFIAETGLHPSECEMVEQRGGAGTTRVWFRKKT